MHAYVHVCMCVWMVRACAVLSRLHVSDSFVSPWTVTTQTPVFVGVSRQECWSGLPFPPPGDLPDPGIEPMSLDSPALAGRFFITEPPGKPFKYGLKNIENKL